MNWNNLKDNKCPKCKMLLIHSILDRMIDCSECDFRMSEKKFEQIVGNIYKRPYQRQAQPEDNFEALQNLGHEEIAADFEDSPYADRA